MSSWIVLNWILGHDPFNKHSWIINNVVKIACKTVLKIVFWMGSDRIACLSWVLFFKGPKSSILEDTHSVQKCCILIQRFERTWLVSFLFLIFSSLGCRLQGRHKLQRLSAWGTSRHLFVYECSFSCCASSFHGVFWIYPQ